ncbi:hypothetical protein J6590_059067 [Homalodisca vitripennis]|nr:hypothetical protein J6590_059067 [Homalodisca vitripennis]
MSEWNRHLAPSIFSVVENMTLGHKKWTEECTDTAAPRIHRVQQKLTYDFTTLIPSCGFTMGFWCVSLYDGKFPSKHADE